MEIMQEKKNKYLKWIAVLTTTAVVIAATCYAYFTDRRSDKLEQQLNARQEAMYGEVVEGIASLESKLYKLSLLPNSAQTPGLLADIWRQTGELTGYLSAITLGPEIDGQLYAFLNQAGDYAKQLFLRSAGGKTLEQQDTSQILQLQTACSQLEDKMENAWQAGYIADMEISAFVGLESGYTDDFSAQEYPRLIYDGPFSENRESAPALADAKKVTQEQALKIARQFAGAEASFAGYRGEAEVPFFSFSLEGGGSIAVAEQGGGVLFWNLPRATDISVIPTEAKAEEIRKSAEQFLSAKGYPGCELSYAQYYGGDALLNFVPLQDGVRLYPDLLKVWVQVDSMQVVGLDASAYVKNNRPRTLEQTAALHDARAVLPAEAAETDCAMAVIPKESGIEVYCYEFFCNFSGRDAIVYVNAKNGSVEDILEIVHVNNGTLTR